LIRNFTQIARRRDSEAGLLGKHYIPEPMDEPIFTDEEQQDIQRLKYIIEPLQGEILEAQHQMEALVDEAIEKDLERARNEHRVHELDPPRGGTCSYGDLQATVTQMERAGVRHRHPTASSTSRIYEEWSSIKMKTLRPESPVSQVK
jgi:hypothetical protein